MTVNPAGGPSTGTGENSAFTEVGLERILEEGRATIDLRGPVAAADLGADAERRIQDLDVRGEDPVEVTVLGMNGDLVVRANVVRILVDTQGEDVLSVALFEEQRDEDALAERLLEVGEILGADETLMSNYIAGLPGEPGGTYKTHFNEADALGFSVSIQPVNKPGEYSLIEYGVNPPE